METRVKQRNGGCSGCVTSWLDSLICESKPMSQCQVDLSSRRLDLGRGFSAGLQMVHICLRTIYPVSNSIMYDKGPLALIVPGIQASFFLL